MTHAEQQEPGTLERKAYLNEREFLLNAQIDQTRSLDKAILTLSGGALALSLTFVTDIIPEPRNFLILILSFSWFFLIVSLLLTLVSFLTSQIALLRQVAILDVMYSKSNSRILDKPRETNRFARVTYWLNVIALVSFVLGVVALTIFVGLGLWM